MLKCKCGNIIDTKGSKDYILSICPKCANKPENAEFMRALNEFANKPAK